MDVETAVAVLFCGPAKGKFWRLNPDLESEMEWLVDWQSFHAGIVLGTPLIQICYTGLSLQEQGIILVPAVLYQGFQIVFGQISVQIIRNWRTRALMAAEAANVYREETLATKAAV